MPMTAAITENHVEEAAVSWLADLGYAVAWGPDMEPDGSSPERGSYFARCSISRSRTSRWSAAVKPSSSRTG